MKDSTYVRILALRRHLFTWMCLIVDCEIPQSEELCLTIFLLIPQAMHIVLLML